VVLVESGFSRIVESGFSQGDVESGFSRTITSDVTDADLAAASTRNVAIGSVSNGSVESLPLEVYVARVLVGEAEPNAPDATQQALAIAIRTYAIFNTGRHAKDGYDLCDATHCQVPRPANASSRRAALATAGRILTHDGSPAEIFYSASCGGRSESVSDAWGMPSRSYLRSVKDDVHDDDMEWTLSMPIADLQTALERSGRSGRLKNVQIAKRSKSGRAAFVKLSGMEPDRISGDQLRAAVGFARLRSTAFSVKKKDDGITFTGKGYGHGVGMCVIGAGRRARRGETPTEILKHYYPGLKVESLSS
jgi:stage II sporulation protein D